MLFTLILTQTNFVSTTHRIQKLNKLFLREISEIINQEVEFDDDVLVTVTGVEIAPDLSVAKVWISTLPFKKSEQVMAKLINDRKNIKHLLNQEITLRKIPDLIFMVDESEERAQEVEEMINKI